MYQIDKWDGTSWNPFTRKRTLRAAKRAARKDSHKKWKWNNLRIYLEESNANRR